MPSWIIRHFFKNARTVSVLLLMGVWLFPPMVITAAFGASGPISSLDTNNQTVNPFGLPENISIDSAGNIIQRLPHGPTLNVGYAIPRIQGKATFLIKMGGNLKAGGLIIAPTNAQILAYPYSPSNTQFNTPVQIFDSLGVGHDVNVAYAKTANNVWQYSVLANNTEVTVPPVNEDINTGNALVAQGTLNFDSSGLLLTESNPLGHAITFSNGSAPANIIFDFGTSIVTDGGLGKDGFIQQGPQSLHLKLSQDGFPPGTLTGMVARQDGVIMGRYSNGEVLVLGQTFPTVVHRPNEAKQKHHRRPRKHRQKPKDFPPPVEFPHTMNAVQHGVWSVGQFGSWHVNVDSSPEHPVAVQDVSSIKKKPWAYTQSFQFQHENSYAESLVLTVPPGSRLFIHHISLQGTVMGQAHGEAIPQVLASMHTTFNDLPISYQLGLLDIFRMDTGGIQEVRHILSKPVRLYADTDTQVRIIIERNFEGQLSDGRVSLTGYLESIP